MIGFICHGAWVPISAKIVDGRTVFSTNINDLCYVFHSDSYHSQVTSHPAVQDDLRNAGATWIDQSCVTDSKCLIIPIVDRFCLKAKLKFPFHF